MGWDPNVAKRGQDEAYVGQGLKIVKSFAPGMAGRGLDVAKCGQPAPGACTPRAPGLTLRAVANSE